MVREKEVMGCRVGGEAMKHLQINTFWPLAQVC